MVWAEPLFAKAKDRHGLRRLRLRSLLNASIQGLFIVAGQNLKRHLAATSRDRCQVPCRCHLALSWEPWRASLVPG